MPGWAGGVWWPQAERGQDPPAGLLVLAPSLRPVVLPPLTGRRKTLAASSAEGRLLHLQGTVFAQSQHQGLHLAFGAATWGRNCLWSLIPGGTVVSRITCVYTHIHTQHPEPSESSGVSRSPLWSLLWRCCSPPPCPACSSCKD